MKIQDKSSLRRASPDYTREAPGTVYEGISIDPVLGLSELLQLVVRRTRLAVSVVLTADHLFWLKRSFSVQLQEPPHIALCFR